MELPALAVHALPASILAPAAAIATAIFTPVFVHRLHLLPLVGGQLAANRQQKTGIRFFQLGPGLSDLVDRRQNGRFVRLIGLHQRLHGDFSFLEICVEIDQLNAMVLHDAIHRFALIVRELELRNNSGIIPELPVSSVGPESALHGRPMLPEPRSHSRTSGALCNRHPACHENSRQNQSYRFHHESPPLFTKGFSPSLFALLLCPVIVRLLLIHHLRKRLHRGRNCTRNIAVNVSQKIFVGLGC